jgi:hypothetical protein
LLWDPKVVPPSQRTQERSASPCGGRFVICGVLAALLSKAPETIGSRLPSRGTGRMFFVAQTLRLFHARDTNAEHLENEGSDVESA